MKIFSLCKKRCTTTINPDSVPTILQSLQFILFCFRKKILYQIEVRMSKRRFFDDIVHFIVKENIVTYVDFDCGITFLPETPTKIRQVNRERNYISRSCENPCAFPATVNISVLLMSSIALISFMFRTFYGTCLQQLLRHSTTIMIDTLYPISTLNQQLTNLEQTHIGCSLLCERWTVKVRDCASALRSFKEITHRTAKWTKQLLRLKSWVISGSPEQWMEFRRLRWTVIAFKCSYMFQLFDFYCLLVQYLLFLKIYFFFFSFMTLSEK